MVIQGLQKLTLLDYPEKVACTVFTAGCNFRCPFCHNASLVIDTYKNKEIPSEEFFDFLKKRQGILDGVCVTGGEPLIQHGIEDFLRRIKELGYAVKLDTNGSFPDKLARIVEAGLVDYVAMDIKNSPDAYAETTGCPSLDLAPVLRSIEILKEGRVDYEFRTTVIKGLHYRENIEKICTLISPCRRYFLQTFVPSQDTIAQGLEAPDSDTMKTYLKLVRTYIGNAEIRDSKD